MKINQQQFKLLLEGAEKDGLTKDQVIRSLYKNGYELDGVDTVKAKVELGLINEAKNDAVKSNMANTISRFAEGFEDITQTGKGVLESSQKRADNITELENKLEAGERSLVGTRLKQAGQLAGAGADAVGEFFQGLVKLGLSQESENKLKEKVANIGQDVAETQVAKDIIGWYEGLEEKDKEAVDAAGGVLALASEFVGGGFARRGAKVVGESVEQGLKMGANVVEDITGNIAEGVGTFKVGGSILPASEEIMNKVARLTPTQARKFEKIAGKTHGQYLKETGNFGTPDEIIKREADKFAESVKSVDDSLAQLEGTFKSGEIDDVLDELKQIAEETSTKNVKSPISKKVDELIAKNLESGLTMSEINEAKRLFEKNVKLGYNKLTESRKVAQATNLDNALRNWQIEKAAELGFENLRELNKQTQISKELLNSLGNQVIGKSGLNNISLTDWIMLSGGSPAAVGGFLTKKFFSSKSIQAKIAQWLSDVKAEPIIKPKINRSKQQ